MSRGDNCALTIASRNGYSSMKKDLARSKIRICRIDRYIVYIVHLRRFSDANEIHSAAAASRFAGRNENSYRSRGSALTFMNGI